MLKDLLLKVINIFLLCCIPTISIAQDRPISEYTQDELIDLLIQTKREKVELARELQISYAEQKRYIELNSQQLLRIYSLEMEAKELKQTMVGKNNEIIGLLDTIGAKNVELMELRQERADLLKKSLDPWKMRKFEFLAQVGVGIRPGPAAAEFNFHVSGTLHWNLTNNFYLIGNGYFNPGISFSTQQMTSSLLHFGTFFGVGMRLFSNS